MIDVDRLRRDTPGVARVVHFNNAGAALMPLPVIEAVTNWIDREALHGGYETRTDQGHRIDDTYVAIGELIGGDASEISMADNATRAWDMAFYGLDLGPGDRILTTSTEYSSNLAAYFDLRDRRGVTVEVVPDSPSGDLDVSALEEMIDERVRLISVNHIPTSSGVVEPVAEVGRVARAHGIPFLLDACQSVGHLPVDVGDIGCDMLSATSRKYLRGPRGIGFLWVRREMASRLRPPFVELESGDIGHDGYRLHDDRRRFETWEKNYAGIAGLGAAVRYALDIGIDATWARIRVLADRLRSGLAEISRLHVHDRGTVLGGITTFSVDDHEARRLADRLRSEAINVSVSSRFASPIDGHRRRLPDMVRASVHAYNTEAEVDRLVARVADHTRT